MGESGTRGELRPGWQSGLVAIAVAASATGLITRWSVSVEWLAVRGAIGGLSLLVVGLLLGSRSMVGMASAPMVAGAVIGLDRPAGHAWGQTLLIGLLWYLASELAWTSIEQRDGTARSPAVLRLRAREVANVIVVSIGVALVGLGLSSVAPVRTATVRAVAVIMVLAGLVLLGRHLAGRRPEGASSR